MGQVLEAESLADRGLAVDEQDDRTVADLLVEQVGVGWSRCVGASAGGRGVEQDDRMVADLLVEQVTGGRVLQHVRHSGCHGYPSRKACARCSGLVHFGDLPI